MTVRDASLRRLTAPLSRRLAGAWRETSRRLAVVELLAEREVSTGPSVSLPWRRRLGLWRHGFTSRSGVLFGVEDDAYDRYLSDYQLELLGDLCGPWTEVVDNKLTSQLLLGSFDEHLPDLYGVLHGGRLRRASPPFSRVNSAETAEPTDAVAWLDAYLDANAAVVLKPVYGHGGAGVLVCRKPAPGAYQVNAERLSSDAFATRVGMLDEYLVTEFVEQAAYAAELFPDAANTLRVVTLWDDEREEPFVSGTVHRIGTDESAPVDNWSRGGLSAEIHDDGRLSRAAQWSSSAGELGWYDRHPDTGERIHGARVPGWSTVRERLLEMAATFPWLPRVGWDLVITGEGSFVVLEVNAHAGVETLQVHRPLLDDPRVRRFYERHGYA